MLLPVAALCIFGVVSLLGLVLLLVYRLYLSPLAKFPGPKLAATTLWYETYYDVFCWGRYGFEIEKMHEKYGPIVRISPYEIHINDPDFYEVLYSRDSPRDKYEYFTRQFSITRSMISTVDHYHHRMLRSNMNPYFSIARVRKHEPVIRALVDKLLDRLQAYKGTGAPVNLQHAFTCFTTDVVSDYTMGAGYNYLDEPDFIPSWSDTLAGSAKSGVYIRVWPWLGLLFSVMPPWLLLKIYPGMGLVSQFQARCNSIVQSIMEEHNAEGYEKVKSRFDKPTFFHDVLNSDLPPEEKEPGRLAQEVQVVIGAGAETTAKMLAWTIYYLLESPEKMNKLEEELNRLDPKGTATLLDYEQMPYLICVMLEGLRLSYGVSTRLQRIAPDRDLQFNEWTIPAGTPVGMSSMLIHHNEGIFPDSRNFVPERWADPEKRRRLEKYLVSFTKGSRQCIGINLARSEILLALPKIVRGLEMELFETTREDVTLAHDLFLPFAKEGRKGIRVLVK
ncbi:cytochrome P450 [Aspergillus pseudoustus]|uniref:Cytochrome P450 n=1 Tax=Aspergillus pseudoustus TaxID=1810923 RepID=A0ABR4J1U7_9EURO